jgi:hypothetical protein
VVVGPAAFLVVVVRSDAVVLTDLVVGPEGAGDGSDAEIAVVSGDAADAVPRRLMASAVAARAATTARMARPAISGRRPGRPDGAAAPVDPTGVAPLPRSSSGSIVVEI